MFPTSVKSSPLYDQKTPALISGTYQHRDYSTLKNITRNCLEYGINAFDTAPSYHTEHLLGRAIGECLAEMNLHREDVFIGTKVDAWQMQDSNGNVEPFVDKVLKEMNLEYLDQLLIHWPIPEYVEQTWDNLIYLYHRGKVKNIGICNVRERHLVKLINSEMSPMIVQNERHPLRTDQETLNFCKKHSIAYQAYSPVGQMMDQVRNSGILKQLALKYDRSVGQIIMRWHIDTGSTPVFMTTKPERLKEYAGIFNFSISDDDIVHINLMNKNYKIFLESIGCPGF